MKKESKFYSLLVAFWGATFACIPVFVIMYVYFFMSRWTLIELVVSLSFIYMFIKLYSRRRKEVNDAK